MKKIIITGGSGYLGRNLIRYFKSNSKHEIINFDMVKSNIEGVKDICVDLKNEELPVISNTDLIIHTAGFADLEKCKNQPLKSMYDNIGITIRVTQYCLKNNIKNLIFSSSMYSVGNKGGFYGVSKACAEKYLFEFSSQHDINICVLRVGSLYGSDSNQSNGLHKIVKEIILKKNLSYNGNKYDMRQYIHVNDASKVIFKITENNIEKFSKINVVGGSKLKVDDVFRTIFETLSLKYNVEYLNLESNSHYSITPYSVDYPDESIELKRKVDFNYGLFELIEYVKNDL